MNRTFLYDVPAHWLAVATFLLIFLTIILGFRYSELQHRKNPKQPREGLGPIETSLLGLMALMLSFTFGLASSKFENRRHVITEEANNIGTAILRCDLYPDSMRRLFHQDFREYLNARIAYYDARDDEQKIQAALKDGNKYSYRIWKRAAQDAHELDHRVRAEKMIPAVNAMIDIVTTRDTARLAMVPPVILIVLAVLMLIASFLVGYGQKGRRNLVLVTGFALMTTIALYVIIELDRPRRGILNLNKEEHRIVELKELLEY
ncbi:MAG TPA: hypothetical protein VFZ47_11200 [Chitinophagaceae bacterium]